VLVGAALATAAPASAATHKAGSEQVTLRLGYFPNVTHAPALVGVEGGIFQQKLGNNVKLETKTFNAGPEAVEALFSDAIDATYIGPSPTINAYVKSGGKDVRVIAGAASGGAFFVAKPDIKKASDLRGKKVASPQLGNTQDVALRAWLKSKRLKTDTSGGGDVSILPQDNALTLDAFRSGDIAGAWVPEPWATRLIHEGGGKILVDERDLWPKGQYTTTDLVVTTKFLKKHPDVVKRLLEGQLAANDLIRSDPKRAQQLVGQGIKSITGKDLKPELVAASFKNITFTNDPVASSLRKSAKTAQSLGLLEDPNLDKLYDLKPLNQVLKKHGQPEAKA
jgi:NitT/TauT family transport system substrate-binding protein